MKARLLSARFALGFSVLALVVAIFAVLAASIGFPLENTLVTRVRPQRLTEGWRARTAAGDEALLAPSRLDAQAVGEKLTLVYTLPDTLPGGQSICFQTKNESVRAYVGDELIYIYGETPQKTFGHGVGAVWNFARLPEDAAGKELTVELTPVGGRTGLEAYRFLLGGHDSLLGELLVENLTLILSTALLTVIWIVTLGMAFTALYRHDKRAGAVIHFNLFVLFATLWMASDSGLMQFVIPDKGVIYMLFGCSFYLLCTPFALFMAEVKPEHKKLFRAFSMVNSAYAAIRIILYVTGVCDFEAALWLLHLLMAALILGVNITLLLPMLRTRQFRRQELFFAVSALSLLEGAALVFFYLSDKLDTLRNGYSAGFFPGIFAFVAIVALGAARTAARTRQQAFKAEFFERRAYTDDLTGLYNVRGFDDKCAALLKAAKEDMCYAVVDFDVNFFSQFNASNGLEAGD